MCKKFEINMLRNRGDITPFNFLPHNWNTCPIIPTCITINKCNFFGLLSDVVLGIFYDFRYICMCT